MSQVLVETDELPHARTDRESNPLRLTRQYSTAPTLDPLAHRSETAFLHISVHSALAPDDPCERVALEGPLELAHDGEEGARDGGRGGLDVGVDVCDVEGFEDVGTGAGGAATEVGGDYVGGVTALETDGGFVVDDGLSNNK